MARMTDSTCRTSSGGDGGDGSARLDVADEVFQFALICVAGVDGKKFRRVAAVKPGLPHGGGHILQIGPGPHAVAHRFFVAHHVQLHGEGEARGHFNNALGGGLHAVFKGEGAGHMVPAAHIVLLPHRIDLPDLAEEIAQIIHIVQVQVEQAAAAVFRLAVPLAPQRMDRQAAGPGVLHGAQFARVKQLLGLHILRPEAHRLPHGKLYACLGNSGQHPVQRFHGEGDRLFADDVFFVLCAQQHILLVEEGGQADVHHVHRLGGQHGLTVGVPGVAGGLGQRLARRFAQVAHSGDLDVFHCLIGGQVGLAHEPRAYDRYIDQNGIPLSALMSCKALTAQSRGLSGIPPNLARRC